MATTRRGSRFAIAALLALSLLLQLWGLERAPAIWFDEGYRFNAARLLAETGDYGTRSSEGVNPFDPAVTAGPLEISLMALSFRLFGVGVLAGRLPFALLTVAMLGLVYHLGLRAFGPRPALFMTLAVAAMPPEPNIGVLMLGRQAMAETPAMVQTLAGLACWLVAWERRSLPAAALAGVFFGLGLLSKGQFAVAVLPTLGLVGLARWYLRLEPPHLSLAPLAGACAVLCGWQLVAYVFSDPSALARNWQLSTTAVNGHLLGRVPGRGGNSVESRR